MTAICRLDLFRSCSDKERRHAARAFTPHRVTAGTMLLRQGAPAREFFVIVDGVVSVRRDGEQIARLGPGECVGEMALLDGGRRSATVVAETGLEVLVCGPREFGGLMVVAPNFTRKVAAALAARVRETEALVQRRRAPAA
jgi:CRP-like cAMP-binding protein